MFLGGHTWGSGYSGRARLACYSHLQAGHTCFLLARWRGALMVGLGASGSHCGGHGDSAEKEGAPPSSQKDGTARPGLRHTHSPPRARPRGWEENEGT